MNQKIEKIFNRIQEPTQISRDETDYRFRRNIAQNYLSYEETIYTGKRSKQDSLKKIHDYAKIWGIRNAMNTLIEDLKHPAQGYFDAIVDPDKEPDMVTGENRNNVLEKFHNRFEYNEFDTDIPKLRIMFNTLVDEWLAQELSDHDLEMLAMRIWYTIWGDIG